jgi:hypothetical protein
MTPIWPGELTLQIPVARAIFRHIYLSTKLSRRRGSAGVKELCSGVTDFQSRAAPTKRTGTFSKDMGSSPLHSPVKTGYIPEHLPSLMLVMIFNSGRTILSLG